MIDKTARIYDDTMEGDWADIDLYKNGVVEISIVENWKCVGAVNVTKDEFLKELRISGIIEEG